MITTRLYEKLPASFWVGRKVRTRHEIQSGAQKIAAGSIVVIRRKRSGFDIETPVCPHCGVSAFIRKCSPSDFEVLLEDEEAQQGLLA